MNQKQQFKLYYGKYNSKHVSYTFMNNIDGVTEMDKFIKFRRKHYADYNIKDVKIVIRKQRGGEFIQFTSYYYTTPPTTNQPRVI
jgi:hypothetical protein